MLIQSTGQADDRLAKLIKDPDIPVVVEASLLPGTAGETLDLGLGAPLRPFHAGQIMRGLAQGSLAGAAPGVAGVLGPMGLVALGPLAGSGAMPAGVAGAASAATAATKATPSLKRFDATIKLSGVGLHLSGHTLATYFPDAAGVADPTFDCLQVIVGAGGVYSSFARHGVSWESGVSAAALGADVVAALGHLIPALAPVAPHAKTVSLVIKFASSAHELHLKLRD